MAHGVAGGRIPGRLAEAHSSPAARSIGGLAVERPGKTQKAGDQHEGDLRKNQLSTFEFGAARPSSFFLVARVLLVDLITRFSSVRMHSATQNRASHFGRTI
jgi:hypothetical protein